MDKDVIVRLVVAKGVRNVNLSMFSEEDKREILEKTAETYLRLGKVDDLLSILEVIDLKKFSDVMRKQADNLIGIGEYEKAAQIYEKIGYKELADSIRQNI
jgi:hypothetical protein